MEGNILNFVENTFSYFFLTSYNLLAPCCASGFTHKENTFYSIRLIFCFVLTPEGKGNCVEIPPDFSFPLFNIQSILHLS